MKGRSYGGLLPSHQGVLKPPHRPSDLALKNNKNWIRLTIFYIMANLKEVGVVELSFPPQKIFELNS